MSQPDVATPAFSRDLAELQFSPYWDRHTGESGAFFGAAVRYPTADDLPPALATTYRRARRALQQVPPEPTD